MYLIYDYITYIKDQADVTSNQKTDRFEILPHDPAGTHSTFACAKVNVPAQNAI